jgi:hypothetical protein
MNDQRNASEIEESLVAAHARAGASGKNKSSDLAIALHDGPAILRLRAELAQRSGESLVTYREECFKTILLCAFQEVGASAPTLGWFMRGFQALKLQGLKPRPPKYHNASTILSMTAGSKGRNPHRS